MRLIRLEIQASHTCTLKLDYNRKKAILHLIQSTFFNSIIAYWWGMTRMAEFWIPNGHGQIGRISRLPHQGQPRFVTRRPYASGTLIWYLQKQSFYFYFYWTSKTTLTTKTKQNMMWSPVWKVPIASHQMAQFLHNSSARYITSCSKIIILSSSKKSDVESRYGWCKHLVSRYVLIKFKF